MPFLCEFLMGKRFGQFGYIRVILKVKLSILSEKFLAVFIIVSKHQAAQQGENKLKRGFKQNAGKVAYATELVAVMAVVRRVVTGRGAIWNFDPFTCQPSQRTVFDRGQHKNRDTFVMQDRSNFY